MIDVNPQKPSGLSFLRELFQPHRTAPGANDLWPKLVRSISVKIPVANLRVEKNLTIKGLFIQLRDELSYLVIVRYRAIQIFIPQLQDPIGFFETPAYFRGRDFVFFFSGDFGQFVDRIFLCHIM